MSFESNIYSVVRALLPISSGRQDFYVRVLLRQLARTLPTFILVVFLLLGVFGFFVYFEDGLDGLRRLLATLLAPEIVGVAGLGFALIVFYRSILDFLERTGSSYDEANEARYVDDDFRSLLATIRNLESEVASLRVSNPELSDADKVKAKELIGEQLEAVAVDHILTKIRSDIKADERIENSLKPINDAIRRMQSEISSLEARGNLNLSIGILGTLIGIGALLFFVLSGNYGEARIESILAQFLPRLSVVLFIQIFAFFFLNLYKSSLSEIQNYHSRMTAYQSKKTALLLATDGNDPSHLQSVILSLSDSGTKFEKPLESIQSGSSVSAKEITELAKALRPFMSK